MYTPTHPTGRRKVPNKNSNSGIEDKKKKKLRKKIDKTAIGTSSRENPKTRAHSEEKKGKSTEATDHSELECNGVKQKKRPEIIKEEKWNLNNNG